MSMPLLTLALCAAASGQVRLEVQPDPAPRGCPVSVVIHNDSDTSLVLPNACPFEVFDPAGAPVFTPACGNVGVILPAGGFWEMIWNQVDRNQQDVAPGTYEIQAVAGGTPLVEQVEVSDRQFPVLHAVNAAGPGGFANLRFCSPADAAISYQLAASSSASTGIDTCAGLFPLDPGPLLFRSLDPAAGRFLGFSGVLDPDGAGRAVLQLPDSPVLSGMTIFLAFVTVDPGPCPFRTISPVLELEIQ